MLNLCLNGHSIYYLRQMKFRPSLIKMGPEVGKNRIFVSLQSSDIKDGIMFCNYGKSHEVLGD